MEHVREEVTLVLVGSAPPREAGLVDRLQALPRWARGRYEGQLFRERGVASLADARAGLVVFQPITGHPEALPNKLFEYMAAALPVIASDFPLWREIVEAEQCGLLVDPQDPQAIASAIDEVIAAPADGQAMGERGRAAFERTYNWEAEAHHLVDLYERVTR